MFDVGGGELLLILLAVLLLFGPKKIPEVAQMVGKGIRQFRKAQEDLTQQIRDISAETASIVEEPVRVKPELRSEERRKESDEKVTSDE